jgi:hypothetical protein
MSENSVRKTNFLDWGLLLKAIEESGIVAEICPEGQRSNLYGYAGDVRQDVADIIIRRHAIGRLANDMGFVKNADGSASVIISAYDSGADMEGRGLYVLNTLKQEYAVQFAKRQAKKLGARIKVTRREDRTIMIEVEGR